MFLTSQSPLLIFFQFFEVSFSFGKNIDFAPKTMTARGSLRVLSDKKFKLGLNLAALIL